MVTVDEETANPRSKVVEAFGWDLVAFGEPCGVCLQGQPDGVVDGPGTLRGCGEDGRPEGIEELVCAGDGQERFERDL
jgi:hypothetical protein